MKTTGNSRKPTDGILPLRHFWLVLLLGTGSCLAQSWVTLHADYQRSGYSADVIEGPYERKWYRDFHDEMIATRAEAIIADGKCFVGTFAGHMYALDVRTGRTVWKFAARGPIGASGCYHDGRLYFGADEGYATGRLYCLNAANGSLIWQYNAGAGIWVSPACDGKKIYFGDRAGVFHAVSTATGECEWKLRTGAMVLKPASFSPDSKKIVFGSEDMHVYCVRPDGELLWKSARLAGLSMRDQGPTIWKGLAIVRTNPADSFHTVMDRNGDLLKRIQQSLENKPEDKVLMDKWGDLIMHPTPRRRRAEQDGVVKYLRENRYDKCFWALNLTDGAEEWTAPVLYTCGLHNPPTPPAFNPRSGQLWTFCRSAMTYYLRGVRRYNALGRIDRETGRIAEYWPESDNNRNWYPFAMIGDETQSLSFMGERLMCTHQGMIAGLDTDSLEVSTVWSGRDTYGGIFGPGAVPGKFDGAKKLAAQGYLTGMPNEWHGPDRAIISIGEGRIFWVVGSQVVCIAGPAIPKMPSGGTEPPKPFKSRLPDCVGGGNVVKGGPGRLNTSVERIEIHAADLKKYIEPPSIPRNGSNRPSKLVRRLKEEVLELIEDGPWAPFAVELGISGEEMHFRRTALTLQTVSLALPFLHQAEREKATDYLDGLVKTGIPLKKTVHEPAGKRRESYDLGPGMKEFATGRVRYEAQIADIYSLWAYAHHANRWEQVLENIGRVEDIYARFADSSNGFDHDGNNDDCEHLNGHIAGLLGAVRIFRRAGSDKTAEAEKMLARLISERIYHERADSRLIRPTKSASKGLHQAKVPRYVGLVPEVGAILHDFANAELEQNVRDLMKGLPLWYQAFGERMIGGENYISPPHLARGVFAAAAYGEILGPPELAGKLDQPWCAADLYYIEKISAILSHSGGFESE